jgi:hypothetical protein
MNKSTLFINILEGTQIYRIVGTAFLNHPLKPIKEWITLQELEEFNNDKGMKWFYCSFKFEKWENGKWQDYYLA